MIKPEFPIRTHTWAPSDHNPRRQEIPLHRSNAPLEYFYMISWPQTQVQTIRWQMQQDPMRRVI
jgi:hypothetical protein